MNRSLVTRRSKRQQPSLVTTLKRRPDGTHVLVVPCDTSPWRLERFAETHEYRQLLVVAAPMAEGDAEPWLAEWLIQPAFALAELPTRGSPLSYSIAIVF